MFLLLALAKSLSALVSPSPPAGRKGNPLSEARKEAKIPLLYAFECPLYRVPALGRLEAEVVWCLTCGALSPLSSSEPHKRVHEHLAPLPWVWSVDLRSGQWQEDDETDEPPFVREGVSSLSRFSHIAEKVSCVTP